MEYTETSAELFDLSLLEEMDDNEYVLEMLNILLLETTKELKEMKKALQAGKIDIVCQTAHKLKSSAGIIQAARFNALLADIETIGKMGKVTNELTSLVDNAATHYIDIEKALKQYVKELQ